MEKALLIMIIMQYNFASNSQSAAIDSIQLQVPNDECVELYHNLREDVVSRFYRVDIAGGCFLHGKRLPD